MFATKIQTPCGKSVAHFVAADPRADGGQRRVSLAADGVAIDRRVAGVAMRLALSIACFRGVSLSLLENRHGFFYRVALDHADPELAVTLAELDSESDIAPEWQAWARFFNLPRLTFSPDECPVVLNRRLGAPGARRGSTAQTRLAAEKAPLRHFGAEDRRSERPRSGGVWRRA